MSSYFRYPILVLVWMVALMSGALSLFRELYGIYSNKIPPRSLFWSCVWIAFVISAAILWLIEHYARVAADNKLKDEEPRIIFNVLNPPIDWRDVGGATECVFTLTNYGKRPAAYVHIEPIESVGGRFTLSFEEPNVLQPNGAHHSIWHEVQVEDDQGRARLNKKMLWEFLHNNPLDGRPAVEYEVNVHFKDLEDERVQKFRMRFDLNSYDLSISQVTAS